MATPLRPPVAHTTAEFASLVDVVRPELHRYCARMIGSVVDAEDVVQEALAKAYTALPTTAVANLRPWLFRIAHNAAIDYLRRAARHPLDYLDERTVGAEPDPPLDEQELVAVALTMFLKLAPRQRCCVILKDVLGYSLADISELLDASVPEIKAALHRGRTRLRALARTVAADVPESLDGHERELLRRYIESFNARDFDTVRAMLADEVQLDLVARTRRSGRVDVGEYFTQYALRSDWRLAHGTVESRAAILVYDGHDRAAPPAYFVVLTWAGGQITGIRDYRYARYVMRDAAIAPA
jgi:RNA polymerase sigma-70 factor (ECF subfamily)